MEHHRYALQLSYHGGAYYGWQRQCGQVSVQEVIEDALSDILGSKAELTGCGRTDKGVHARGYWAHFDANILLKEPPLVVRLNKLLPADIAIHAMQKVDNNWHARFDAVDRTYRYYIHYFKDPFRCDRSFWLRSYRPDFMIMQEACDLLKQYDDFGIFEKRGSDNTHSRCDIKSAEWIEDGAEDGVFFFQITANRFLRNMVRRITATLLETGLGKLSLPHLQDAMEGKATLNTGMAVPASGLHLWEVTYKYKEISGEEKK
jgi:tRNA pseudouridine38-40 synthase